MRQTMNEIMCWAECFSGEIAAEFPDRPMKLAPPHRRGAPRAPAVALRSGAYVTDGQGLFRVISQFASVRNHVFASLEDCRTLEIQASSTGELNRMRLRPVQTDE